MEKNISNENEKIEKYINQLVSVIIPVYGVEDYLDRCLKSIVNQTYMNIEIILIDDGSPDNCPKKCDEWGRKDSRIKVIHKQNGGLASARKTGFRVAKGDYILFVDSDDYIDSDMIQEMTYKAISTGLDIIMCSYIRETKCSIPISMSYKKDIIYPSEMKEQFIFPIIRAISGDISTNGFMHTKLYKASKIKEKYFVSEQEYFTEDILFNIQMALDINGIGVVNKPFYHYFENRNSLTLKYRTGKFEMWNRRTDFLEEYFKENGWLEEAKERIIILNLVALLVGVDNEVLKNDKKGFKIQCNKMRKKIKERGYIKIRFIKYLNGTQAVIFLMFLFRIYNILFRYRKYRIKRYRKDFYAVDGK